MKGRDSLECIGTVRCQVLFLVIIDVAKLHIMAGEAYAETLADLME